MAGLFALLAIATFVLFLINLLSPKTTFFRYNKQVTAKKSSLIYGLLSLVFFILFSAVDRRNNVREIQDDIITNNSGKTEPVHSPMEFSDSSSQVVTHDNDGNYSPEDQKTINKIKTKVKRDYPTDYYIQKSMFDQEVDSYVYMKTVTDLQIKKKVQRDYPMDFYIQKSMYNQEVDAKEQMK